MERFDYFRMKPEDILDNVINKYKLKDKDQDKLIYCEVGKGMYGLLQAGCIS